MPKLIEETEAPKSTKLEWAKVQGKPYGVEGWVYKANDFVVQPEASKFALYLNSQQICKGPLKVCQGFAQDIADGKLASGNWGAPETVSAKLDRIEAETKAIEEEIKAAPKKKKGSNTAAMTEAPKPAVEAPALTEAEVAAAKQAVTQALTPAPQAQPAYDLPSAIAILSKQVQITSLPNGSFFCLPDGRFGQFIEPVGQDAKVVWDGKPTNWSSAVMVLWAPLMPKGKEAPAKVAKADSVKDAEIINAAAEAGAAGVAAAAKPPTASLAPAAPGKSRGPGIFGFSAVRVLNWMGLNGWTKEDAGKVLAHYGVSAAPATMQISMRNGATGKQPPAGFSAEQIQTLKALVGKS